MKNSAPLEKRQIAIEIIKILHDHGYMALFAGGYVRDMVMGNIEAGDIDIATNATPDTISKLFKHTVGVGEQFGVMIVIQKGQPFEVATFRSDIGISDGRHPAGIVYTDPQSDAQRRDFTINGMFYDPISDKIIDYVSGMEDIQKGIIRAIGEPRLRFREDYLRMLRAIRFAARFEFKIEKATWGALVQYVEKIDTISPERIFAEVDRMLRSKNPDNALRLLERSGLLDEILPDVAKTIGVEQPPEFHPEGDVFIHTVKALSLMKPNPSSTLAWSVLLHDIGKPATMTISDRIRFHNHDRVGAAMAEEVLRKLRASNALIEQVIACIENHMNFMNVRHMRLSTLKKLLSKPTIEDELELHRVDCLASHGDLENFFFIRNRLSEFAKDEIKPPPLISGKDLIRLGFKPGPAFGEILSEIYDLQLEEKIHTPEEALEEVRSRFHRR